MFVKRFRSHKGAVAALAVSPHGDRCATMCVDGTAKVYEVATFDMIVMLRLKFVPGAMCFVASRRGAAPMLAISERDAPKIWLYDVGGGNEEPVACLEDTHQAPVTAMCANAALGTVRGCMCVLCPASLACAAGLSCTPSASRLSIQLCAHRHSSHQVCTVAGALLAATAAVTASATIRAGDPGSKLDAVVSQHHPTKVVRMQVVSCDTKGFIKYWDAETHSFPSSTVSFSSMFATNLMDCVKAGVTPKTVTVSKCGLWIAVTCSDMSALVIEYKTGKLQRRFDASMEVRIARAPSALFKSHVAPAYRRRRTRAMCNNALQWAARASRGSAAH